ncbi:juvenile hormone esterase-like [Rhodnius prolixus]|uniref:juvenile hormone esterase-like n=1 Tax=Rhodnius prolixus TaxID=13249 RepID=UPI003D18C578
MIMFYIIILLEILLTLGEGLKVTIETRLGTITGLERRSKDGNLYYAFTRIPYAKPPIGELRFKNPVELEPWKGSLDATQTIPKCLQLLRTNRDNNENLATTGQEDCLYLNIYTPKLPSSESKLAVLVYIHGGGFKYGSMGSEQGADYFMDENIILVTLHYRINILGFLSTEDTTIPGNFGLKDQAMALKWLYKNVDIFGGDPEKLTIFGGSAGAVSTHYHMISPLSKNLIKGAISQSGAVNKLWGFAQPGVTRHFATDVAQRLGCANQQDIELLKCLQQVPAEKLVSASQVYVNRFVNVTIIFRPTREPVAEGAFLTSDPMTEVTTLPWITGVNTHDGLLIFGSPALQNDSATETFIEKIDEVLPQLLSLNESSSDFSSLISAIKDKYFKKPITIQSARNGLLEVYRDYYFNYQMSSAIARHKGPLFQYYYDYRGANSHLDVFGNNSYGAAHGDELISLLNWEKRFPKYQSEDVKVSKNLVKMWANFAKTQKPSLEDVIWPDGKQNAEYMHITQTFTVERNFDAEIISWWTKLNL